MDLIKRLAKQNKSKFTTFAEVEPLEKEHSDEGSVVFLRHVVKRFTRKKLIWPVLYSAKLLFYRSTCRETFLGLSFPQPTLCSNTGGKGFKSGYVIFLIESCQMPL